MDVNSRDGSAVYSSAFAKKLAAGETYTAQRTASLAAGAQINVLVKVGAADDIGMRFRCAGTKDALIQLHEGTTLSSNGTALSLINRNRQSVNTAKVGVFHTPGISGVGTVIIDTVNPEEAAEVVIGGETVDFEEFILKKNTNYLLRITNQDAALAGDFTAAAVDWYER